MSETVAGIAVPDSPMARAVGFRLVHAFPLELRGERIGTLCLADTSETPLSAEEIGVVTMLASGATIGIVHQRAVGRYAILSEQLRGALNSRVLIEQAKGVIAERCHIATRDAFHILRRYARNRGLALRAVAEAAIEGEIGADDLLPERRRRPASGQAMAGTSA